MKKVRCTLPNASDNINGIPFEPHPDGGMVTVDPIDDAIAERLASIKGYEIVDASPGETGKRSGRGGRGGRGGKGSKPAEPETEPEGREGGSDEAGGAEENVDEGV